MPNKPQAIFIILLFTCLSNLLFGQSIIIGTIESNYQNWNQSKENPYFAVTHFEKLNNNWFIADSIPNPAKKINFSIFYNNRLLTNINGTLDNEMERTAYLNNAYRITANNIPRIGTKSYKYSGWLDTKIYRPLVISSSKYCKQHGLIKARSPKKNDRLIIEQYLKDKAIEYDLGAIPHYAKQLVDSIEQVLFVNDSCFIIEANINLNMYCYQYKVPFGVDTLGGVWDRTEQSNISIDHFTPKACFLVKGNKVQYLDHNMTLLDYGDYDNDGYDEILFKVEKYNNDGYLLITDELTKTLLRNWSYH